jgi:hypothetical protein
MRTIIAGSRRDIPMVAVRRAIENAGWQITSVLCGDCKGVDKMGEIIAGERGWPVEHFPVTKEQWNTFGAAAGPMRNRRMAEAAEALIAVWDGKSKGTLDMIRQARAKGLRVHVEHHFRGIEG